MITGHIQSCGRHETVASGSLNISTGICNGIFEVFYIQFHRPQVVKFYFSLSSLDIFIPFIFLIVAARTSNTMLNTSGGYMYVCLVPDLKLFL